MIIRNSKLPDGTLEWWALCPKDFTTHPLSEAEARQVIKEHNKEEVQRQMKKFLGTSQKEASNG